MPEVSVCNVVARITEATKLCEKVDKLQTKYCYGAEEKQAEITKAFETIGISYDDLLDMRMYIRCTANMFQEQLDRAKVDVMCW